MNPQKRHTIVCAVLAILAMAVVVPPSFGQTEKGIELYNAWRFKEAEKVLQEAVKANPNDVAASFFLGLSFIAEERHAEALGFFQRLDAKPARHDGVPDAFHIKIGLARAQLGLKQAAEAWKTLDAAEKLKAGDPEVLVYRGVYYIQEGKNDKAIAALEKAISLDEHNIYAHYHAGHAYLRSGNPAKAVDMFKLFLQLAPQAPEAAKTQLLVAALC